MDISQNLDQLQRMADLYNGFAQKSRLALLLEMDDRGEQNDGKSPYEVAEGLGISRPGIQNHLHKMMEVDLIKKSDDGSYELSVLGEFFVDVIQSHIDKVNAAVSYIDREEEDTITNTKKRVDPELVSDSEWSTLINQKKWDESVESSTKRLLGMPSDEQVYSE